MYVNRSTIFAMGLLFPLLACGGLDLVEVPLSYDLVVRGGLSGATGEPFPGTGAEIAQTLQNQGVAREDVDAVRVVSITLTHREPVCELLAGCDLSFLEVLRVYAEAPGLPKVELGALSAPGAVRQAHLGLFEVDLAAYVAAPSMTLSVEIGIDPDRRPVRDVGLLLEAVLEVDVNVI